MAAPSRAPGSSQGHGGEMSWTDLLMEGFKWLCDWLFSAPTTPCKRKRDEKEEEQIKRDEEFAKNLDQEQQVEQVGRRVKQKLDEKPQPPPVHSYQETFNLINPPTNPSIHPPTCPSIHPPTSPSIHPSTSVPTHPSTYCSTNPLQSNQPIFRAGPTSPVIPPPTHSHPSSNPSIHPSINPSSYSSHSSVHPSSSSSMPGRDVSKESRMVESQWNAGANPNNLQFGAPAAARSRPEYSSPARVQKELVTQKLGRLAQVEFSDEKSKSEMPAAKKDEGSSEKSDENSEDKELEPDEDEVLDKELEDKDLEEAKELEENTPVAKKSAAKNCKVADGKANKTKKTDSSDEEDSDEDEDEPTLGKRKEKDIAGTPARVQKELGTQKPGELAAKNSERLVKQKTRENIPSASATKDEEEERESPREPHKSRVERKFEEREILKVVSCEHRVSAAFGCQIKFPFQKTKLKKLGQTGTVIQFSDTNPNPGNIFYCVKHDDEELLWWPQQALERVNSTPTWDYYDENDRGNIFLIREEKEDEREFEARFNFLSAVPQIVEDQIVDSDDECEISKKVEQEALIEDDDKQSTYTTDEDDKESFGQEQEDSDNEYDRLEQLQQEGDPRSCLPDCVRYKYAQCVNGNRRTETLPDGWKHPQNDADYQQYIHKFFTGDIVPEHDWTEELEGCRREARSGGEKFVLSVWQAAGYLHAKKVIASDDMKGSLFWWTPGSGKSIMVALLIELLVERGNMKVVVVSTPQNINQNNIEECIESLLKFSPVYCKKNTASVTRDDVKKLQQQLKKRKPYNLLKKDFLSFKRFQKEYVEKDMKDTVVIIDECHEIFSERWADATKEILSILSKCKKVFCLSGTPWRNKEEMIQQLRLVHRDENSVPDLDELRGPGWEECLQKCVRGCVSYVDGTMDRSHFPTNGGWQLQKCTISEEQLLNFAIRCDNQIRKQSQEQNKNPEPQNVNNVYQLSALLQNAKSRKNALKAIKLTQVASGIYGGGRPGWTKAGLFGQLENEASLKSVEKFAPKFAALCRKVLYKCDTDLLQTKHFVYSVNESTVTNLRKTLDKVVEPGKEWEESRGRPFYELRAEDFEWEDVGFGSKKTRELRYKCGQLPSEYRNAIVFIVLKGRAPDKQKLKAAFGYVTPDSQRFEGLERSPGVPLVQILIGTKESNQGLTFLRLQHIHIMEPNPTGWGKIVQTIGRGVRRGTHTHPDLERQGKNMKTVRTTIYLSILMEEKLEQEKKDQLKQLEKNVMEARNQHRGFFADLKKVKQILVQEDELSDKYTASSKKIQETLRTNLWKLGKQIQQWSDEKRKVEQGWLRVRTGKLSKRTGEETTKLCKTWKMLPDEAVFFSSWWEEEQRNKYDEMVKTHAFDFKLLRDFHCPDPSTVSESLVRSQRLRQERDDKVQRAENQYCEPQEAATSLCKNGVCAICKPPGKCIKSFPGVSCVQGHFMCATCYHVLRPQESAAAVSRKGPVPCQESTCFVRALQPQKSLTPLYWKCKDTSQKSLFSNTSFMAKRLEKLIQKAVCSSGCGNVSTSAKVVKVLRVENGPLWSNYCAKKEQLKKMKKSIGSKAGTKLQAKSMAEFLRDCEMFPTVKLNASINELFLFHGTRNEAFAKNIALNGFDLAKANPGGLYGGGIYCADQSCKSMQYTSSGEKMFLICRVLMGANSYRTTQLKGVTECPEDQRTGIRFDSVFAGSKVGNAGKQHHNEFVVYNRNQVYPEYIVHIK